MNSESTLSDKYIAGFLDADGSIGLHRSEGCIRPSVRITFSQKKTRDEVIHLIRAQFGGALVPRKVGDGEYTDLCLGSKASRMLLERVANHLVIKRAYARWVLDVCAQPVGDWDALLNQRKERRRERSMPLPNYPSRKWLAGYFDGDGCFGADVAKTSGVATVVFHIACAEYDTEGLELISKAFGGGIFPMRDGSVRQWAIRTTDASRVRAVLGHFVNHLVVKRAQGEFLMKCAAMGHFRDGKSIKAALKHLKSHPHRLSESASLAHEAAQAVVDLPPYKRDRNSYLPKAMRQSEVAAEAV